MLWRDSACTAGIQQHRLKNVMEMWRHSKRGDVVFTTKLDEFDSMMTAVTVKDKQAVNAPRLGVLLEVLYPREGKLII